MPVDEQGLHRGPGGFWAGDIQRCTADDSRFTGRVHDEWNAAIEQACADLLAGGTGILKLQADGTVSNISQADAGLTVERMQDLIRESAGLFYSPHYKLDALVYSYETTPKFEYPKPRWMDFWPMKVVRGNGIIGMDFGDGGSPTGVAYSRKMLRKFHFYGRSQAHSRKILREWRERRSVC